MCNSVDAEDVVCSNELALGEGSSDARAVLGKLACSKLVLARNKEPEQELAHSMVLELALEHSMVLELALEHSMVLELALEHSKVQVRVLAHSKVLELGKLACSNEYAEDGSNAHVSGGCTSDHAGSREVLGSTVEHMGPGSSHDRTGQRRLGQQMQRSYRQLPKS